MDKKKGVPSLSVGSFCFTVPKTFVGRTLVIQKCSRIEIFWILGVS